MAGTANSEDGKARLSFSKGIKAQARDGTALKTVSIIPVSDPGPAPVDARTASLAYDFGPDGASFNPGAMLTLFYDPATLPAGLAENKLILVTWDGTKWAEVAGYSVFPGTRSVSVQTGRPGRYALIGYSRPPSFTLQSPSLSPAQANTGETVTISATVSNSGDVDGTYTVVLKINGKIESTQSISVAGNASQTVTFALRAGGQGKYDVDVNGQSAVLTVWEATGEPEFRVGSLSISRSTVEIGDSAVVSVFVENNGDAAGTYPVLLKVNGSLLKSREVNLAPHSGEAVEFTVAGNKAGLHAIDINGETGSFTVNGPPAPPGTTPSPSDINWWMVAGFVTALSAVSSLVAFRLRWRAHYVPSVPPRAAR
jgi:hypothetical protein